MGRFRPCVMETEKKFLMRLPAQRTQSSWWLQSGGRGSFRAQGITLIVVWFFLCGVFGGCVSARSYTTADIRIHDAEIARRTLFNLLRGSGCERENISVSEDGLETSCPPIQTKYGMLQGEQTNLGWCEYNRVTTQPAFAGSRCMAHAGETVVWQRYFILPGNAEECARALVTLRTLRCEQ